VHFFDYLGIMIHLCRFLFFLFLLLFSLGFLNSALLLELLCEFGFVFIFVVYSITYFCIVLLSLYSFLVNFQSSLFLIVFFKLINFFFPDWLIEISYVI